MFMVYELIDISILRTELFYSPISFHFFVVYTSAMSAKFEVT